MSWPAYQLHGEKIPGAGSGALGTSELGTSPLGGNVHTPVPVPSLYIGSDDMRTKLRVERAGPEHRRHGVLIGARTWAEIGRWKAVHHGLTAAEVASLRTFYTAMFFRLLPTGDVMGAAIPVIWTTREFNARQIRGGRYDLEYELEEQPWQ